jgi:hypothetical protein
LKTQIEYRILEEHARSVFGPDEGQVIGRHKFKIRVVKLDADDPRWVELARLYDRLGGRDFYGWQIRRTYSLTETRNASLHLFQITTGILPTGEDCGTQYNDHDVCPLCGAGRVQVSPLRLNLTNAPKRAEFAESWHGEAIISVRVVRLLIDAGMTGFGLGPVQRSKKGDEEPFTFSETSSGKRLLNSAIQAGIPYPSPQFYVWINTPEQRRTFLSAVEEHNRKKLAGRRLLGGTSADWYQLFVTSSPVELAPVTRFGINPFDDDRKELYRCPLGLRDHVIGMNLLSQVAVQNDEWKCADFIRSRGLVGIRGPRPLLFVSPRLRELLLKNKVKGWTSEVAKTSGPLTSKS